MIADPAALAACRAWKEVIPLLPSLVGQSLGLVTRTGTTCHQMALTLISALITTWLWFGVGRKTFAVGGFAMEPRSASTGGRSEREACMVQVPGAEPGSGHCV